MNQIGRKLRRKLLGTGPWHFVALDHGIGLGFLVGQDHPVEIAVDALERGANAVVCHKGLLGDMVSKDVKYLFLQLFGSLGGGAKVPIAAVKDAHRAGCIGVAVELRRDPDGRSIQRASEAIRSAQREGLLTLLMAGSDFGSIEEVARVSVAATQLGADFIKIGLSDVAAADFDPPEHFKEIHAHCSPLLLAGGDDADFSTNVEFAVRVGFKGTCIGRRYFEPKSRAATFDLVVKGFSEIE